MKQALTDTDILFPPRCTSPFLREVAMVQAQGTSWKIAGQFDVQQLHDGLTRLEGTGAGRTIAAAIREQDTVVRFGQIDEDAIAHFDPDRNEIVIHQDLRDASPSVLAAHLAHEGTHVQWGRDDSIDQEYHAYKAQAEIWNELKGNETDAQCDWVSGMISLGKDEAMIIIRELYPELPEYA